MRVCVIPVRVCGLRVELEAVPPYGGRLGAAPVRFVERHASRVVRVRAARCGSSPCLAGTAWGCTAKIQNLLHMLLPVLGYKIDM